jgi:hypothetical protein
LDTDTAVGDAIDITVECEDEIQSTPAPEA